MKTKIKSIFPSSGSVMTVVAICLAVSTISQTVAAAKAGATEELSSLQMDLGDRKVVLYPPEIDELNGERITARSALSVALPGKTPVFGAARFSAKTVNKKGKVTLSNIFVEDVTLPQTAEDPVGLKQALNRSLEGAQWVFAAEKFNGRVAPGANSAKQDDFAVAPPKIYYEEQPAVLVLVDGEPILKETADKAYQTVVNTAYFIVYDVADRSYYLKGGKWWYRATDLKKEWIVTAPKDAVRKLADAAFKSGDTETDSNIVALRNPPKIILSTEPAELVVVNGAPDYVSIDGTGLLYIDNTESNVLVDVNSQLFYILLAGRWYASPSIKGPWRFVPPEQLPGDFAKIPASSNARDVLVSVPGTGDAENAALAAAVPEIAAVDRHAVSTTATYDGAPRFERIAGTRVAYATNSNIVVLKINGRYFAVDNGIWFEAASSSGPWIVATVVPDEVQDIPPSAPVYQVRYVYVYDYTPEVVYVGYTPGYYCSYVYRGTVVYGTGYYYRPWWGSVYYPYPVTYGFGVHYNPYTGFWGYPVGVSYGWIGFSWFASPFGFWGPAGYMYGYRHGYYHHAAHGYYHGYRHGYHDGYAAGRAPGYRASIGGRPVHASPYTKAGPAVRPTVRPTNSTRHKFASSNSIGSTSRYKNVQRPSNSAAWQKVGRSQTLSESDVVRRAAKPTNAQTTGKQGVTRSRNSSGQNPSADKQPKGNMFHQTAKPVQQPQGSRPAQTVNRTPSTPPSPTPKQSTEGKGSETKSSEPFRSVKAPASSFQNFRSVDRPVKSNPAPSRAPSRPMPSRPSSSPEQSGGRPRR